MSNNSLNNECLNDFTITSSSTTARVLTVQNTSNTASSDAAEIISVAGASAGDCYLKHALGTTAQYSTGIDNSDADTWKLTYAASNPTPSSGTECIRADSGGGVRLPSTVMFRGYLAVGKTNVTGDGADYTIPFDSESFDIGSNFNSTTGVFTAPIAGHYLFYGLVRLDDLAGGDEDGPRLVKNSTATTTFWSDFTNLIDANGELSVYVYDFQSMAASDTMKFNVLITGESGDTVDISAGTNATYFGGFLVG